jgi:hypothetical protein
MAVVLAADPQGNGPLGPVDRLVVSEAWEPIPLNHARSSPEEAGADDREVEEGGLNCPHPTEAYQTQEIAPTIAEVRRTQFPPKTITPQAEMARLRRREKKILFD